MPYLLLQLVQLIPSHSYLVQSFLMIVHNSLLSRPFQITILNLLYENGIEEYHHVYLYNPIVQMPSIGYILTYPNFIPSPFYKHAYLNSLQTYLAKDIQLISINNLFFNCIRLYSLQTDFITMNLLWLIAAI